MSITTIAGSLLPVRRDGQIAGGSSISLGGNSGGGTGGGGGSMIWPAAAGIAVYDGSNAWGTSIADASADWNEAHGWGDWAYEMGLRAPLANPTFTGTVIATDAFVMGSGNEVWSQPSINATADLHINYRGYASLLTQFRNTLIDDGKGANIALFDAATHNLTVAGDIIVTGNELYLNASNFLSGDTAGRIRTNGIFAVLGSEIYLGAAGEYISSDTAGYLRASNGLSAVSFKSDSIESSTTFSSGFFGDGYKIIETGGKTTAEFDNLRIRGTLSAYELEINKISSVNGGLLISVANGTAYLVSGTTLYFDTKNGANPIQFKVGDYIKAQNWTGASGETITAYVGVVTNVTPGDGVLGNSHITCTTISGTAWNGIELVQMGGSDADRQSMIYLTAHDPNNPYIAGYTGVTDADFTGHLKFMLGNLQSIASTGIVPALPGFGLYSDNVYLTGKIVANSGTIGGFIITATELYAGSGATRVEMQAAGGFWAGADLIGDAQFSVTPAGVLTAKGIAELGTATANYGGSNDWNIAIKGADIWENAFDNDGSSVYINGKGYNGGTTKYRNTWIGNGRNDHLMYFQGADNVIDTGAVLYCNNGLIMGTFGSVATGSNIDATKSTSIILSQRHNLAVAATDITCTVAENDINGMSITITPKGTNLLLLFTAPFYASSNASFTLLMYQGVTAIRSTRHYCASGQPFTVVLHHLLAVTAGVSITIKMRWSDTTAIEQRGATDAMRELTVIDLM